MRKSQKSMISESILIKFQNYRQIEFKNSSGRLVNTKYTSFQNFQCFYLRFRGCIVISINFYILESSNNITEAKVIKKHNVLNIHVKMLYFFDFEFQRG